MSWPAPRLALGVALATLVAAALVAGGRSERESWAESQMRGMGATLELIGPLDSPSLSGYRVLPAFDCLVYRRGQNPFALEACIDAGGRVVETIDRRRVDRRIDSLRSRPQASTLRVDRGLVDRLLQRMGSS